MFLILVTFLELTVRVLFCGNCFIIHLKRAERRQISAPKFYFFDVGIVNHLARRGAMVPGSELFGRAFEHFLFAELTAYLSYTEKFNTISIFSLRH